MNYFDPFDKSLESVTASDLERLRDISEGWYVEYKREAVHARNVAKSLSAFSNHFGGWLIFGINAPNRVPVSFPGLDISQCTTVMTSLREAVRHHINPVIHFDSRAVEGPNASLGLCSGRSVLIVRVPQGQNPPYIHSSGRIYRRVDDASDPKAETDRAVIDMLTERSREYCERFQEHIGRRPEFADAEKGRSTLQVFLTTDPWREHSIRHVLAHDEFARIMTARDDAAFAVPLESSFPTAFGFVARQVGSNDPFNITYTWHFSHDGFSSVVFPLRALDEQLASGFEFGLDFLALLPRSLRKRVIDVTGILAILTSIFAKHDALAKEIGIPGSLYLKMRFSNVWRRVPFLDTKTYVDHVRQHGIPVIQQSELLTPPGLRPDDMLEVEGWSGQAPNAGLIPAVRAGGLLPSALGSLGIPYAVFATESSLRELLDSQSRVARVYSAALGRRDDVPDGC